MITTVTLNASVDKLYLVNQVELNLVMRVESVYNTPGGKGLNVARVAALMGERVRAMGFLGGFSGQYVRSMLKGEKIRDGFTEIAGETRSCINIRDVSNGQHTEFLEPGCKVTEEEVARFVEQYQKALDKTEVVTISGSIPEGVPDELYGELTHLARSRGIAVLLDTSGRLLETSIRAKPTLIKPNIYEAEQLLGRSIGSREEAAKAAMSIHKEYGIPLVVISMGADGAVLASQDGVLHGEPPNIPVVNTVGCGDSMLAGFAAGLRRGYAPEEMLTFATALSSANALSVRTGYVEQSNVDSMMPQVRIAKIEIN